MRIFDSPDNLDEHILRSYSSLPWFMGGVVFVLPLLLVIGGVNSLWWLKQTLSVQNSLSAYYHAGSACVAFQGVYRDLFVGLLAAISFCLIIYTGFGKLENWLLNLAGVCLAGVAFFPTDWPEPNLLKICQATPGFSPHIASLLLRMPVSIHVASAIAFFLVITAVNVLTAMDTVHIIQDSSKQKFWHGIFRWARWLMPISLGLVLWLEWAAINSQIGWGPGSRRGGSLDGNRLDRRLQRLR